MEALLLRVNENEGAKRSLKAISLVATLTSVLIYILMVASSFFAEPMRAVALLFVCGISFALVSTVRKIINAKRPYEEYDFLTPEKNAKSGLSFPSRHVFSAFIIGTVAFTVSPMLAIASYIIGVSLAACRVLLGIHYLRDVIFGAALGVFFGALGILVILI